jgi:alpha-L-rhamnosidase
MLGLRLFTLLFITFFCTSVRAPIIKGALEKQLTVKNLRVEYLENPLALDVEHPRFSWFLEGAGRNRMQTAYQLIVSSTPEGLEKGIGDIWDSGKTASEATNQIEYAGKPLAFGQRYYWQVMSWDENDQPSAWSERAYFSMGMLNFSDWQGAFIGLDVGYDKTDKFSELYLPPARYLRKSFNLNKPVRRAIAYATAQGVYELRLNGEKVGDKFLLPGWTDYNKRLYYQAFDITDQLTRGENVIGAILGDGWYAGYLGYALLRKQDRIRDFYGANPSFMGQIVVEYIDGTTEVIASGRDWKANEGPIREADLLMGERYDARLERPGWDAPGYNDNGWRSPRPYHMSFGSVEAYPGTLLTAREWLPAKKITEPAPGVYVFDLGKNFAGIAAFQFEALAGTEIRIRYGEILKKDGNIMTANLRTARATDYYITKGDGVETWQPRFTYHGFQFVEITGLPAPPELEDVTGIALSSIDTDASTFIAANPLNNQLYENIKTTQKANFFEIPTDCPQRDERLGWTGDAQIFARSATFNADVAAFFTKWLVDLDDSQLWYGAYPNFAPHPYALINMHSPAWMDAGIIVPHTMYQVYGDTRILERVYPGMQKFMAYQAAESIDYLRPPTGNNYGDWLNVGKPTSKAFIASVYYGYDARLMAEMATALGKTEAAAAYRATFVNIRKAVAKKYILPTGFSTEDTQTSYALLLYFGLYPEELAEKAAARLAELITNNGDKFTTGFLGTKHIMLVLSDYGYHDLAYRLFQQTEYPSWGYSVVNGSTSIWERWNSYSKDDEVNNANNAQMNSFSHYSLGAVAEWMFVHALGIETNGPGYRKLRIQPAISREMDHLEGSYTSINGTIHSSWGWDEDEVTFKITIPANTTAEIHLPVATPSTLREGGNKVKSGIGMQIKSAGNGQTILEVGSGNYTFTFTAT